MKLLWLWILIIFGVFPDVVWNKTNIVNNISNNNQWEKVASYLYQVLLNDDSMKKGHVKLLIVDFTVNHDIDELLKYFNENSRIMVNLINTADPIKLKYPDFVIIIQDFMELDFKETRFVDDFYYKLNELTYLSIMDISAKYFIINSVNTKMWTFPSALEFVAKCVNIFRTGWFDNLMFIDRYDSSQFAIIKPIVKNNLIFFQRQSSKKIFFPISKMGEMNENIIKLLQFDGPPFSKVENGNLLGTEGKLLNTFCERFNTSYTIVNKNSTVLKTNNFHQLMYNTSMDFSLNYNLRVNENKIFGNIISNE